MREFVVEFYTELLVAAELTRKGSYLLHVS